jgi:hypothetical protein
MMTAKRSFTSSFVRLAPLGLAAALAACGGGGGGGSGGSSSPTPVTLTCPILSGATSGFTIGGCISGQTYGSVSRNEQSTLTFSGTQTTLAVNGALNAVAPVLFDSSAIPTQLATSNTLGGLVSTRFLERQLSGSPITTSAVGEFSNSAITTSVGVTPPTTVPFNVSRVRFGTWEYGTTTEAYFGTWYQGNNSLLVAANMPTTGTKTYTGVAVGYLWPVLTTVSTSPLYGVSATFSMTVNYATRAYTVTINGLRGSQASPAITNFDLSGSLGSYSASGTYPTATTSFTGSLTGTNVNPGTANFEAQFFGATTSTADEIAGRIRLDTATTDGRRLVMSFAAK